MKPVTKSVMILWAGRSWEVRSIETDTLLTDDLPNQIQLPERAPGTLGSTSPDNNRTYTFVLAGRCAEYPVYQQLQ